MTNNNQEFLQELDKKREDLFEKTNEKNEVIKHVKRFVSDDSLQGYFNAIELIKTSDVSGLRDILGQVVKTAQERLKKKFKLTHLSIDESYTRDGFIVRYNNHSPIMTITFTKKERRLITLDERHWINALKYVFEDVISVEVENEIENILNFFKGNGFKLKKNGFKKESHYVFKTPHRWEESHIEEMTMLQRIFSRKRNAPTREEENTHHTYFPYSPHPLLSLIEVDDESGRDWYERRFVLSSEWNRIRDLFKGDDFSFSQKRYDDTSLCGVAIHKPSGNKLIFYPNGHIVAIIPEDADPKKLTSYVGILPLFWTNRFDEWIGILIENTKS